MTVPLTFAGGSRMAGVPSPINSCNACEPALPDTLYATWSGLGGDLAWANTKLPVGWLSGCSWRYLEGDHKAHVYYDDWPLVGYRWTSTVFHLPGGACSVGAYSPTATICDPYKSDYNLQVDDCGDSGCVDGNTCENSVGASAEVTAS